MVHKSNRSLFSGYVWYIILIRLEVESYAGRLLFSLPAFFEKIMEEVSHKQLLEKRRMYYNLYMAQVDY